MIAKFIGAAIVGLVLLGVAPSVIAQDSEDLDPAELRVLAEQGSGWAQNELGFMYGTGKGVPQDYAEAVKWFGKAADQGYAEAQSNLGLSYGTGKGVPQDYAEAVKWYRRAADQGYAKAQVNLGVMYGTGQGVPQDYVQAHLWSNLAGVGGDKIAAENRDSIAAKMTPAQIAEAQKLAREWKPRKTDER